MFKLQIFLFVLFLFKSISSTPVDKQETNSSTLADIPTGLITGAPVPISVTDPEVQKSAKLGLEVYAQQLKNKSYEPIIHSIVSATEQIVAGTIYQIKIKFGESTCAKGQKTNCALKQNGESEDYNVEVYISPPWMEKEVPKVTLTRL